MSDIVGGQFRLRRKIGAGSFGEIYSGENIKTHRRVAIKLEDVKCEVPQLGYESKLYAHLQGGTGIPNMHWSGTENGKNIMVMDLLGKSLEDLFIQCNRKFSLKTVLMLADQMISCLEFFHQKNFLHRDIKPDNFVLGLGSNSNQVFIIDYGLAKRYRDQRNHLHVPFSTGKSLTGTARYASVAALRGDEQSRKDDLEAVGYVLMYFLRGSLPWMGSQCKELEEKYKIICDIKAKTSFEDLCEGFPQEFVKCLYMVRNLGFAEAPNYSAYRQLFRDLFIKSNFVYDYKYDWCIDFDIIPPEIPVEIHQPDTRSNPTEEKIDENANPHSSNLEPTDRKSVDAIITPLILETEVSSKLIPITKVIPLNINRNEEPPAVRSRKSFRRIRNIERQSLDIFHKPRELDKETNENHNISTHRLNKLEILQRMEKIDNFDTKIDSTSNNKSDNNRINPCELYNRNNNGNSNGNSNENNNGNSNGNSNGNNPVNSNGNNPVNSNGNNNGNYPVNNINRNHNQSNNEEVKINTQDPIPPKSSDIHELKIPLPKRVRNSDKQVNRTPPPVTVSNILDQKQSKSKAHIKLERNIEYTGFQKKNIMKSTDNILPSKKKEFSATFPANPNNNPPLANSPNCGSNANLNLNTSQNNFNNNNLIDHRNNLSDLRNTSSDFKNGSDGINYIQTNHIPEYGQHNHHHHHHHEKPHHHGMNADNLELNKNYKGSEKLQKPNIGKRSHSSAKFCMLEALNNFDDEENLLKVEKRRNKSFVKNSILQNNEQLHENTINPLISSKAKYSARRRTLNVE
ncbi:hypothetical protein TRFO_28350 [Tritrichomonas foetus]|uniref:non-specific serine/threonine protein kinase n=1 Tax=Tritrichomonas foetus TaxID=1144522 RepID=A0A1J4K3B6_9EUKA|nr:hypothetical protein TRFO_28350 [Tritrichomonas foetus]|eukprot:OHT04236.1 hypothetical protein TRFO_28350 [Tritrichomonas foetus]